jgi:subtilisin family serine protease
MQGGDSFRGPGFAQPGWTYQSSPHPWGRAQGGPPWGFSSYPPAIGGGVPYYPQRNASSSTYRNDRGPPSHARHRPPPKPPALKPAPPRFASNAYPPPPGETRYRLGEIVIATSPGVSPAAVAQVRRRHGLIEVETTTNALTGQSLRLWRFPESRPVPAVVRELGGETALASVQPNYIYAPQDDAANAQPPALEQYWLAKLKVDPSLDRVTSEPVRVAVIDTAIDDGHPDLKGVVEDRFDALGGVGPAHALEHGTSMAGAIAARGTYRGVAPTVRILSARALDRDDRGLESGSTLSVIKAIDWAARKRARIINMSFDGPMEDPELHSELAALYAKGVVLIAAAGNEGPKSPPRYPGADESVIAVTATDANDAVYAMANAGSYIALAAPGVDVLLTAPNGGYAMETGTSVSAALVSGVAALLIERRPQAKPLEVKGWLTKTAQSLGPAAGKGQVGAGLVDARSAAEAAAR